MLLALSYNHSADEVQTGAGSNPDGVNACSMECVDDNGFLVVCACFNLAADDVVNLNLEACEVSSGEVVVCTYGLTNGQETRTEYQFAHQHSR